MDQCQARTWDGICRHTALSALAQLRAAAIRNALTGSITLPSAGGDIGHDTSAALDDGTVSDADLQIPLGDAAVPVCGGQPRPPGIAAIKLSIAETARLARLAFMLRWSRRRRCHQAAARWHHYSVRLLTASG